MKTINNVAEISNSERKFENNNLLNWNYSYKIPLSELQTDLNDCLKISVRPYTDQIGEDHLWLEMHYPNGVRSMGINKTFENDLLISSFLNAKGVFASKKQGNEPLKSLSLNPESIRPFTLPVLRMGKEPETILSAAKKLNLIAKNKWCVEFQFYDRSQNKMIRFRLSSQLNRIKNYKEKLSAFRKFQTKVTKELKAGWNPVEKTKPMVLEGKLNELMIGEAINRFIQYHKDKGNRENTITSYWSKLKLFLNHVRNINVKEINDLHITDFLNTLERTKGWTPVWKYR